MTCVSHTACVGGSLVGGAGGGGGRRRSAPTGNADGQGPHAPCERRAQARQLTTREAFVVKTNLCQLVQHELLRPFGRARPKAEHRLPPAGRRQRRARRAGRHTKCACVGAHRSLARARRVGASAQQHRAATTTFSFRGDARWVFVCSRRVTTRTRARDTTTVPFHSFLWCVLFKNRRWVFVEREEGRTRVRRKMCVCTSTHAGC
jgi:hypothetical protein